MIHDTRQQQGGFTLVELTASLLLSVLVLYSLHGTLRTSIDARVSTERAARAQRLAETFVQRLQEIPFGRSFDPAPGGWMLDELFDDDDDLGTITLHQVKVAANAPGHTFQVAGRGLAGDFRVKVCNDLDGNGTVAGGREGRNDLLRIEVWFDGRLFAETLRAAEFSDTTIDRGVVY